MINHLVIDCEKQAKEMAKGCPGCDKVFDKTKYPKAKIGYSYKMYKKHITEEHNPILCAICSATCYGKKAMDEHLGKAHDQNCLCKYCGKIVLECYLKRDVLVYLSSFSFKN